MFDHSFFSCLVVATVILGNISVRFIPPDGSRDKHRTLTAFLSAAYWFKMLINAACRDLASVSVRIIPVTEVEIFAFVATMNKLHPFSHSILEGNSATSQKTGSPAIAHDVVVVPPPEDMLVFMSRSAMLNI